MVSKSRTFRRPVRLPVRLRGTGRLVALTLASALAGCASTVADLPTQLGGLPTGTPERQSEPTAYPAVHDMPPPRQDVVLTDEEQKRTTAELAALRARQAKQAAAGAKKPSTDQ
jgi:hypothetical protein